MARLPQEPWAAQRFPFEALALSSEAAQPLFRQLEDQIREAIRAGRIRPGERLPSTRDLARQLGVARNTTKGAYNQLLIEGYLEAVRGSGTRVARNLPEQLLQAPKGRNQAASGKAAVTLKGAASNILAISPWIVTETERPVRPFRAHTPSSDAFPRQLWAQLTTRRLRGMSRALLERADPRGFRPLREAVAGYLGSARGVACTADQVIITAGAQQAIEIIAKLLLEPGDHVCMEDPGYLPAKLLFELARAKVASIGVDAEGLDVPAMAALGGNVKLVYVTPGSQFPLGMSLSLPRRLALIDWAERSGALILEDDYNGEYRYAGRPLPALHGLAPPGRVLYIGSFSKLLFPALRLGYVVVPPDLVDLFAAARWLIDRHSPPLEQVVLADFIEEGHFARHVRRMRTLYAERQAALVEAAAKDLAGILDVPPAESGLHLIGWLGEGTSAAALLEAAGRAGVEVTPTSLYAVGKPARESVVLGYAPFPPRELQRATRSLARAIDTGALLPRRDEERPA